MKSAHTTKEMLLLSKCFYAFLVSFTRASSPL